MTEDLTRGDWIGGNLVRALLDRRQEDHPLARGETLRDKMKPPSPREGQVVGSQGNNKWLISRISLRTLT